MTLELNKTRPIVSNTKPSMTKQSFKEQTDINQILKRYKTTGTVDHIDRRVPRFGDFTGEFDFAASLNMVREAQDAFMALPAEVRRRFGNDPGQLLDFIRDAANADEARDLGLLADNPEDPNKGLVDAFTEALVNANKTGGTPPE